MMLMRRDGNGREDKRKLIKRIMNGKQDGDDGDDGMKRNRTREARRNTIARNTKALGL